MNTAVNPYQPPRAEVADVHRGGSDFQAVKVWSSKGRIGRLRYLAYLMGGYLVFVLALGLVMGLSIAIGGSATGAALGTGLMVIAMIPYLVLTVLCAIQRCHDIGWSGWMSLLTLVPLVNMVVGLMLLLKGGDAQANAYGAPPVPNTRGVKILAWIAPAVVLIGMLAAVALPKYQQYKQRSLEMPQRQGSESLGANNAAPESTGAPIGTATAPGTER